MYERPKILIIDYKDSKNDFRERLLKHNYSVEEVDSGREALKLIRSQDGGFDILLMNIKYGKKGLTGLESAREIKKEYPGVSIILLTDQGEEAWSEDLNKVEAYAFLEKEITGREIEFAVQKCLNERDYNRKMLLIDEVGKTICSDYSHEIIRDEIVRTIKNILGWFPCSIILKKGTDLEIAASEGYSDEFLKKFEMKVEEGITGTVAATGETANIADIRKKYKGKKHKYIEEFAPLNLLSMLSVPLIYRNNILGAMNAHKKGTGGFKQKEALLMESLANQAAVAIQNARYRNEIIAAFNKVGENINLLQHHHDDRILAGIIQHADELTNADRGCLVMYDPHKNALVCRCGLDCELYQTGPCEISLNEKKRLVVEIFKEGKPRIEDIKKRGYKVADDKDVRCQMGVPLIAKDNKIQGVLSVDRFEGKSCFTDMELSLLESLGQYAVIIENTSRSYKIMKDMENITKAIGTKQDLQETLKIVAQKCYELFPQADEVRILELVKGKSKLKVSMVEGMTKRKLKDIEIRSDEGLCGICLQRDQAVYAKRFTETGKAELELMDGTVLEADPKWLDDLLEHDDKSILSIPLRYDNKPIGVLQLSNVSREDAFDLSSDMPILTRFADQAAIAIWKERLIQKERERNNAMKTLARVSANIQSAQCSLNETMYYTLTGVTIKDGLAFNRAALFLYDEKRDVLDGMLGVGSLTAEEAKRKWEDMVDKELNLDKLLSQERPYIDFSDPFNRTIINMEINLSAGDTVLSECAKKRRTFNYHPGRGDAPINVELVENIASEHFAVIPLFTPERQGVLYVDNKFEEKPISDSDMQILKLFGNEAVRAVDRALTLRERDILADLNIILHDKGPEKDYYYAGLETMVRTLEADEGLIFEHVSTGKWRIRSHIVKCFMNNGKKEVFRRIHYDDKGIINSENKKPAFETNRIPNALFRKILCDMKARIINDVPELQDNPDLSNQIVNELKDINEMLSETGFHAIFVPVEKEKEIQAVMMVIRKIGFGKRRFSSHTQNTLEKAAKVLSMAFDKEEYNKNMKLIDDISKKILSQVRDEKSVIDAILDNALEVTGSAYGYVGKGVDPVSFEIISAKGLSDAQKKKIQKDIITPQKLSTTREVYKSEEPYIYYKNPSDAPDFFKGYNELIKQNIQSVLAVKLSSEGRTRGVLNLKSLRKNAFDKHRESMVRLADYAMIALTNAGHFVKADSRIRKQVRRLKNLSTVTAAITSSLELDEVLKTIIEKGANILNADLIIFRYDPINKQFKILIYDSKTVKIEGTDLMSVSKEFVDWMNEKKVRRINDSDRESIFSHCVGLKGGEKIRSELLVPLICEERKIGLLAAVSSKKKAFVGDDEMIFEILGRQAAVAINNTQIKEKSEQEQRSRAYNLAMREYGHWIETRLGAANYYLGKWLKEPQMKEPEKAIFKERFIQIKNNLTSLLKLKKDLAVPMSNIETVPVELHLMTSEIYRIYTDALAANNFMDVNFILEISDELPKISADSDKFLSVIHHLIVNSLEAFKKAPKDEMFIKIRSIEFGDDFIVIEFSDNAGGISPEQEEYIFAPFYSTKGPGSGFGLWFCKHVMRNMRGEISVRNNYGEGVSFFLKLRKCYDS